MSGLQGPSARIDPEPVVVQPARTPARPAAALAVVVVPILSLILAGLFAAFVMFSAGSGCGTAAPQSASYDARSHHARIDSNYEHQFDAPQ